MTPDEIAAMQAGALAGTPGDLYSAGPDVRSTHHGISYHFAAATTATDARRIARFPRMEAAIAALTAERDALKAAKWDVQHTDAMNDFGSLGIDRDEWEAKAKALTAQADADQIKIEAQAAEIAQMRDALESLAYIHDGNPSDARADTPPLDYARHMLWEARCIARAALVQP